MAELSPPLLPRRMVAACANGHKRKPWTQLVPLPGCPAAPRSGLACVRCSKTWEYVGDVLVETCELQGGKGNDNGR